MKSPFLSSWSKREKEPLFALFLSLVSYGTITDLYKGEIAEVVPICLRNNVHLTSWLIRQQH